MLAIAASSPLAFATSGAFAAPRTSIVMQVRSNSPAMPDSCVDSSRIYHVPSARARAQQQARNTDATFQ